MFEQQPVWLTTASYGVSLFLIGCMLSVLVFAGFLATEYRSHHAGWPAWVRDFTDWMWIATKCIWVTSALLVLGSFAWAATTGA